MELVLRINKTSISINNWVIFFHIEMIGIEYKLNFHKSVVYEHSKYMGKYSHGSSLRYI